ncbi:MAG: fumarate reductase/succinate dehydrogenase flavoprotein subunit, partial [Bacteroidales bacterium]|nr:fumarate reductase/succinate dehydrogenase flavoprotein subunit [Bacteroidales bacterium]
FEQAEKDVQARIDKLMTIKGKKSPDHFHKRLGKIMWEYVGMARTADGLAHAKAEIAKIREEFYKNLLVVGTADSFNPELEKALRIADFIDMGELMAFDAAHREESCGGHFREEYQTPEGEAMRNDKDFMYVGAWEYKGEGIDPELHKEDLAYEEIEVKTRNYK